MCNFSGDIMTYRELLRLVVSKDKGLDQTVTVYDSIHDEYYPVLESFETMDDVLGKGHLVLHIAT